MPAADPPVFLLQVPIDFGSAGKEDWARLEEAVTPLEVSNALTYLLDA